MNVKKSRYTLISAGFIIVFCFFVTKGTSQIFYLGLNVGPTYSWFDSPKLDNVISSSGWGHDLGFFLRYGRRPYFQAGFDWTRSNNDFVFEAKDIDLRVEDKVPFHNFDFSLKVGYELVQTPYFKWSVFGGPFIGRSLLFNSNEFEFSNTDFVNPQYGFITGTGFQVTNFILSLEYNYHLSGLFKPIELDGVVFDFGSKLQIVTIKLGMQF